MATSELRKLVIAAIAAAVVPAAITIGTWAVWHSVPAAHHLAATSSRGPASPGQPAEPETGQAAATGARVGMATGLSGLRPPAGRTSPAAAVRLARGQSPAPAAGVPREIRVAAPGETAGAGVIHVAVTHERVPRPATFEIGPFTPKPDMSVACGTCRGNVLEVNF